MQFVKKLMLTFLSAIWLLCCFPMVAAAQSIDTNRYVQLDIVYEYDGTPVSDARVDIYRVGNIHSRGRVTLRSPFSEYPIDPALLYSGDTQQLAKLLYHYILLNQISPSVVLTMDEEGKAQCDLAVGLYLVVPQKYSDHQGILRSEPALISLPYRASTEDPWVYQVTYLPKCSFTPKERIGTMDLYVTKQWEGISEAQQPKEITVYLLKDNAVVDQVKLNKGNRWLYRWESLSEQYDWRVVEKPLSGYTVTMSGNAGSVLLTNTEKEIPDDTEPTETTEPEETKPPQSSGGGGSKLPQTGLLWWPVPVLLFLGVALIYLGMGICRGADYEE